MTALSADILFLSVRLFASSRKAPALPEGVTKRIRSRICRAHQALRVFFVRAAHRRACTTYFPMRASHFIRRTTIEARFPPLPTLPCGGLPMQKVHQAHPPSGDRGYKKVVWLRETPLQRIHHLAMVATRWWFSFEKRLNSSSTTRRFVHAAHRSSQALRRRHRLPSHPPHPPAESVANEDRSDRCPPNGEEPRAPECCRRTAGSFREWRSAPG